MPGSKSHSSGVQTWLPTAAPSARHSSGAAELAATCILPCALLEGADFSFSLPPWEEKSHASNPFHMLASKPAGHERPF